MRVCYCIRCIKCAIFKFMRFSKTISIFLLILFSAMFPLLVSADDINTIEKEIVVNYEKINPKNLSAYQFKRFKEEVILYFYSRSKTKKAEYLSKLIDSRLAELKYTVDKDDMASFEEANNRYFSSVGKCTEYLIDNNFSQEKTFLIEKLNTHKPILENMKNKYEQTTAQWRFIRDNINYIDLYTNQLGG